MEKVHKTFVKAEKKHNGNPSVIKLKPNEKQSKATKIVPGTIKREPIRETLDLFENIKVNIHARYPNESIKTILFAGTAHGSGTSTIAANFATTMAGNCNLNVLLIEANLRTPDIHAIFDIEQQNGLSDIASDSNQAIFHIKKAKPANLSLITAGSQETGSVNLFESDRFYNFLSTVRDHFDYIVLDGPPVPHFSEARVLCRKVDGIVLVFEAGKTREQVAVRAKKELEDAGAKILGVVLNKRKHYIPEWLYKRL